MLEGIIYKWYYSTYHNTIIPQYHKQKITEGNIWETVDSQRVRKKGKTTTLCKKGRRNGGWTTG